MVTLHTVAVASLLVTSVHHLLRTRELFSARKRSIIQPESDRPSSLDSSNMVQMLSADPVFSFLHALLPYPLGTHLRIS